MKDVRHILRVAMLLAAVSAASAVRSFAQDDVETFQKITLKQIMGGGWTAFERTFAALMSDARNDDAFREISVVVGEAGALNKVAPYLETLVKQRPTDAALRTILGRVYKDLLRDPTRARIHFEAVLGQDPDDFFAHYQLAALSARQGDKGFAEAVDHYRSAAEKVTRQHAELRTRILKELGELLYSRRQARAEYVQEAFDAWDAMTTGIRRFDLVTYEELADEYRVRSLWRKVQETYERYFTVLREINDTPDSVTRCRLRTRIAEACEHQERYADAIEAYTEAVGLLDENTWQRRKLEARVHECREKLGQLAVHEQALRKTVADNPGSVAPRQSLARVLVRSGRLDEAAALLEEARRMAPRHVPVLSALESLYRRSGRDDDLAGVLRARIEFSSEDFDAYVALAEVHVRRKETSKAEAVLTELESSKSELPEKFLLLARAYGRYGLVKRAFVLYRRLIDGGTASAEERFEFCDFCLVHEEFTDEAAVEAGRLCDEGVLRAGGYVTLADVFRRHGKTETALGVLLRGLSACVKRPDGTEDASASFTLNTALSDLEHSLGEGHHAQAIAATLKALLSAPDLHFKRKLNDRLVTLLMHYGHRQKLLYAAGEERKDPGLFGGPHGEGLAPWVDFLNVQANSREAGDLWMLLGQIHETVEVDAELPSRPGAEEAQPRKIKTDIAQARLCYQKVVDMEFQNLDAHLALARVLADPAVDEYEQAVNELEVLSLLNPVTKWESIQAVGDLYADAGETALARAKWREVAERSASEPNLLAQIAMRMFRADELERALTLAGEARTISPYVFRYRVAYAYLLARAAAAEHGTDLLARYVAEMTEALRLAESSAELADFVPGVKQGLFEGRTALARRYFERDDFNAAKGDFEAARRLLASSSETAGDVRVTDAELQVARCVEALGGRDEAMKRYESILRDRPDVPCWVSTGVTVSGESFLLLKRSGRLVEGPRGERPAAAGVGVQARLLSGLDLHADVRGFLADDGRLYVEGTHRRFLVDASAGKLDGSSVRPTPLDPGPLTLLAAGPGRAVVVQAGGVRAVNLQTGEGIWSKEPRDLEEDGRLQTVMTTGPQVVVGGTKGIRVLRSADGAQLWRRPGDWTTFDVDDRTLALLTPTETGGKELLTLEPATGRVIATRPVSASTLWHPPVLAGDVVLLTDSFNGRVSGFDVRTGRERFVFALDVSPIRPLTVVGPSGRDGAAIMHTVRDGTLHVTVLDLDRLNVRFESPVRLADHAVLGLSVPPLVWRERLLYLDAATGSVLALDTRTGKIEAVAPAEGTASLPADRLTFRWTLSGDTLCLVGSEGEVRFWRLSAGE